MPKPTAKRIDKVAKKLFVIWLPYVPDGRAAWKQQSAWDKNNWRRLAEFVLTEPGLLPRKTAMPKPKSCKLVRGKAVCK